MNRPLGHPLLIFLVCAGGLVTVYSLTLLPLAATFLVVGLVAVAGASVWLYRSRAPGPAEISDLCGISHPAELNEPEAVHGVEVVEGSEVADEPDDLSEPLPGQTPALLPEQWRMLQRWLEEAAQAHSQPPSQPEPERNPELDPATDDWVPPEMPDVWEPEPAPGAPVTQPATVLPPAPVERTPLPQSVPAAKDAAPQAETPALTAEAETTPAPAPASAPPPPRRAAPVFAQATTYQDGEITKRSQIALRLSGRMHR